MTKTVLLTGASGFIGKHIVLQLLQDGYRVRGTVRSERRAGDVRTAVAPHLPQDFPLDDMLSFAQLDLGRDEGWDDAMAGADALLHTASPFPLVPPKDPAETIEPAVEGTRRALDAAAKAGISRVVLTSSVVSAYNTPLASGDTVYDERYWSDPEGAWSNAYVAAKTLAERAAWDMAGAEDKGLTLTTILPGMVLGPPLDDRYGASLEMIERFLSGKDPGVPKTGLPFVDVRDVARAHVRALSTPESEGKRILVGGQWMWFSDLAAQLQAAFPHRKVATRELPNLLVRLVALVDPGVRLLAPVLGVERQVSNARAQEILGIDFIPAGDAALEAGRAVDRLMR